LDFLLYLIKLLVKLCLTGLFILCLLFWLFLTPTMQRTLYPLPEKETVFRYAQENRLDPYLVAAVIHTESRFQNLAESPSGALGLMQLMPDTAQWAAGQMDIAYDQEQLFETEYNVRMGTWYLRYLLDEFGDSLPLALAAYNAGRGNVSNWLKDGRWDGTLENLSSIPFPETRDYVRKVFKNQQRYQKIYGTDVD
jgi:soluble lytic murein transglycosylase